MVRDHHLVKTAEIEDQINLPMSRLHLVRCTPLAGVRAGASADPLQRSAGRRPPAWRPKPVDQGIPGGRHTKRPEQCPGRQATAGSVSRFRGLPDMHLVFVDLAQCRFLVLLFERAGEDGGDEETRTPDPLLAKEMLFRLSYVPLPFRARSLGAWWVVGVSGLEPETSALSGQCSNQLS